METIYSIRIESDSKKFSPRFFIFSWLIERDQFDHVHSLDDHLKLTKLPRVPTVNFKILECIHRNDDLFFLKRKRSYQKTIFKSINAHS
jgi:hypothetical protein